MLILEYKDVGVPSEPLTRQSHTAKSLIQGSDNPLQHTK